MAMEALSLIANFWYSIFGSGMIMALVIFTFLIMIMVAFRANLATIMVVVVPLVIGFVLNTAGSNMIQIPTYTIIIVFQILAILFAGFLLLMFKGE